MGLLYSPTRRRRDVRPFANCRWVAAAGRSWSKRSATMHARLIYLLFNDDSVSYRSDLTAATCSILVSARTLACAAPNDYMCVAAWWRSNASAAGRRFVSIPSGSHCWSLYICLSARERMAVARCVKSNNLIVSICSIKDHHVLATRKLIMANFVYSNCSWNQTWMMEVTARI